MVPDIPLKAYAGSLPITHNLESRVLESFHSDLYCNMQVLRLFYLNTTNVIRKCGVIELCGSGVNIFIGGGGR